MAGKDPGDRPAAGGFAHEPQPGGGFSGPPADGGLSIDRLAQAFAAMMGAPEAGPAEVVAVDASPDLDAAETVEDEAAAVTPHDSSRKMCAEASSRICVTRPASAARAACSGSRPG